MDLLSPIKECYITRGTPRVGFNLVSWDTNGQTDTLRWGRAVREMYDAGIRDFTIIAHRFVNKTTGDISPVSAFHLASPPKNTVISFALKKGRELGMRVSLNPFVEIDNPGGIGHKWRGTLTFSELSLRRFFCHYTRYLTEMAVLAREGGACRLYIGSELSALSVNPSARKYWSALIQDIRQVFGTRRTLTYAASHNDYIVVPFWNELDEIGIDAYFSLVPQAIAAGRGRPSVKTIQTNWEKLLEPIKRFGEEYHKPVIFSEWGTVPFDLTTSQPWHWKPSEIPDPDEQLNAYKATLQTLSQQGEWLKEISLWHWAMLGNEGSLYRVTPETEVARFISYFI
jgi:hypothetical protein